MDPLLAALALVGCRLVRSHENLVRSAAELRIIHPSGRTCFCWDGIWFAGGDFYDLKHAGMQFSAECDWQEVPPLTTKARQLLTDYLLNAAPHGA